MNTNKKKILYIITHLELGGAQKQLLSLLEGLKGKYSLYLCTGNEGYLKNRFLGINNLEIKLIPELVREINPFYDFIAFIKLFKYIRANQFDFVHVHSPKASLLGRWAAYFSGVKNIIYTVHGWPFHDHMKKITYFLFLLIEKMSALITKKIIVVSNFDFKVGFKKITSSGKLACIHYGIDVKRFDDLYQKRLKKSKPDKANIINISCFKPQKDIFSFLDLVKKLVEKYPDLNFMLIGDGFLRKKIEEKIKLLNLENNVELKGWVDNPESFFEDASMFILTSLWEGLPVALIEAVISGVGVVVTDTGGLRDIVVNNKQGLIVESKNASQIYLACINILDNYEKWDRIFKDNRKTLDYNHWSVERMVDDIDNLYQSLL